ncbi:hypothetical protein N7497_005956 [Penicillium chrysogenum]|nr:hypothetical protein N7497_005956 [Penicillium chrysogenum]
MPPNTPTILLLGTCDTKLSELLYTKSQIESTNATVLLMDTGRNPTTHEEIAIPQSALLTTTASTPTPDLTTLTRAEYITTLIPYATKKVTHLHEHHQIHGILAIGGSCGTTLAATVMRDALPVGFPKLLVSTMASGDVGPFIGETDISMMYSVVDIAGRNRIVEGVLDNAAGGIVGMAGAFLKRERGSTAEIEVSSRVRIGISMFGVTTPGVTRARERLEEALGGYEVVGGVLSAGPGRLTAATVRDIPRVKECVEIGRFIAGNLLDSRDRGQLRRTKVILPVGGVSMLDVAGQPFHDPEADEALFSTLERELEGSGICVMRDPRDINDPNFAVAVADELVKLIRQ